MQIDIVITRSGKGSGVRLLDHGFKTVRDLGTYDQLDETKAIADARAWCVENGHVVARIAYPSISKMTMTTTIAKPERQKKSLKILEPEIRVRTRKLSQDQL
jgi:hypothetical protein